jgi:hypothetical protein
MFSPGVERALRVALEAHAGQFRKGVDAEPYAVHPLHVALMLARLGADEEVIQAGLLHDVVEDGPSWTLERLEREFGPRVRKIVAELTEDKTRPWNERKEHAIESLPRLCPEAALVKACDKLHNLNGLLAELRRTSDPGAVWLRFKGGSELTLSKDRRVVEALGARVSPELGLWLHSALEALEALSPPPSEARSDPA